MHIIAILGIQLVMLGTCIGVKIIIKRLLNNLDGFQGVSTNKEIEYAKKRSQ